MTDVHQKAAEILHTGYRFLFTDDYGKRMDFFAEQMQKLDPSTREALLEEILKQDSGATRSWLTVDRLDALVGQGTVTDRERQSILQAFGKAYVDGEVDFEDAMEFTDAYALNASTGPDNLNQLLRTLVDANDGRSAAFIQKFATDMFTHWLYPGGKPGDVVDLPAYAGVLLNALDQAGGSAAVHAVLGQLSPEQRSLLRDGVSAQGDGFQRLRETTGSHVHDPMAILVEATSRFGTAQEVTELAHYIGAHEHDCLSHDNKPLADRAEALGEMFASHFDQLAKDLLLPNPAQTPGSTNEKSTVVGENLAALSCLVRLTALNPDSKRASALMDKLGAFTSEQVRTSNHAENTDANGDGKVDDDDLEAVDLATTRLAMIGAVMQDAVASGYVDLRNDIAARKAFVGYMIDLGVSAIPAAGGIAAKAISRSVSNVLGGLTEEARKQVEDALSAIPKKSLTDAQGRLTQTAKKAILDALPKDYAYLEGIKARANGFIEDALLGVSRRDGTITTQMASYKAYIDGAKGH